ncbi:MAG: DMT family transporter [Thalassobaculum sp.]|uniref:DMT family transporter n=1 Tax=Thalassobaculum sp. TaxID=2022740 RepID=UPI0032EBB183
MSLSSPAVRAVLIGNAALAVTVLCWGSMVPLMHELLRRHDALEIAVLRYAVAAPLLLAILVSPIGGRPPAAGTIAGALPRLLALGVLGVIVFATAYTFGIYYAGPVQASIVGSAAPVIAVALGWLLNRDVPDRTLLLGIAVAVPGTALALSAGNANALAAESPWILALGVALVLLANVAWSLYSALARRWMDGWPPVALTAATIAAGGILFSLGYVAAGLAGLVRFPPPAPTLPDAGLLVFVAVFGICLGVVCWNLGVARLGLSLASLYLNVTPIVAIGLSAVLGADVTAAHLAGTALVILGIGGAQVQRLRDARAADRAAQTAAER